ncbi:MAG: UDP-N-acetylmuramoyl-tripeptide--D-alanyl-D-alanine ligase [Roseburia sp.]|nr:UDP-N-acetylmuramoyl-tripeptide--D-alanyl-D-alanine ligase [Roseburia sp.]MCM1242967.1 UDP-N-acetylmuramoyl-tripeptide--D-alanyl-D-alanine ligase [Roseburia sp.]
MDILLWVIWLGTYVLGAVWFELYIMHMFQQNSYKPREYGEWLRVTGNIGRILGKILYAVISLPLIAAGGYGCLTAACCMNIMTILVNKPRQAKKPLVCTARVKRMFMTTGLLFVIVMALCLLLPIRSVKVCVLFLLILFIIEPVLVLAVNLINHPLELGIDKHYINDAARILREMPDLTVIGVTGSYGKTSVKYFLSKLLSTQFCVLHTPGNYNTTLGVVRTIREQMKSFHEIFICEMGAREVGDIKEICDLVHPQYGIITSIGPQHLQSFHSIENVINTKFELADAVPAEGKVFLNYDNEYIRERKIDKTVVSYGVSEENADYAAYDISVSREGSAFKMKDKEGTEYQFHTRLVGNHNVQNIAGAVAVANTLGIPMEKLLFPVKQLESVPHRLQLLKQGDRIVLDDSYNSNKSGFKAALDTLAMFDELRILMTPGMVELGEKQYDENKEIGLYAHDKCDYAVLVGREQTRPIQVGLLEAGFPHHRIIIADTLQEAFQMVNAIPGEKQKVVLIENDLPDNYQ